MKLKNKRTNGDVEESTNRDKQQTQMYSRQTDKQTVSSSDLER